ncbi:hypothetical protein [Streptomyces litchfieldiae]|uniref:Integral membrane protein n=1 Tax=Streptomyces litchfieldiae TaxID=3075543 RepID=A0ABU2N0C6_9ACTN|nr:hypothetical protein [Streptomyces sp. DSM 44938]MDT0346538.1 hypothetical protein [Streptomyces sp. DSM 44938]
MGWAVLYIAFGVVALWLLGEVLLQYKARLRWRLVAFCGFLCVVVGVLLPSVFVIALGTAAFATGQTFVTLSFRRGFSTGWALGGKPGTSKRRREVGSGGAVQPMPPLPEEAPQAEGPGTEEFAGYQDGAGYGEEIYAEAPPQPVAAPDYPEQYGQDEQYAQGEQPYQQETYQDPYAAAPEPGEGYPGYPAEAYPAETPAWGTPGTDWGTHALPAEPQPDHQTYAADYAGGHGGYADEQATAAWGTAGSADAYYQETPPGGLWVPQQRESPVPDPGYGPPGPDEFAQPAPQYDAYDSSGQGYYFTDDQRY